MSYGWTPERRERQAVLIREFKPWTQSTGPRTEAGRATCAKNSWKHGLRSRRVLEELRLLRAIIRGCRSILPRE